MYVLKQLFIIINHSINLFEIAILIPERIFPESPVEKMDSYI